MDQRVKYWIDLAEYDFETASSLLRSKRYLYVGFMCHQAIEKVLKAVFVKVKDQHPPKTHNLRVLAKKCLIWDSLDQEQCNFLIALEPLNIEARYPTDKEKLFKSLTKERCENVLNSTRELFIWLKIKLQELPNNSL